jgi:hypothetical protein
MQSCFYCSVCELQHQSPAPPSPPDPSSVDLFLRYRAWSPQVLPVSAHSGLGVPALARLMEEFMEALSSSGELQVGA